MRLGSLSTKDRVLIACFGGDKLQDMAAILRNQVYTQVLLQRDVVKYCLEDERPEGPAANGET